LKTNSSATIYNRYLDPITLTDKWQKHLVHQVYWEGGRSVKLLNGLVNNNACRVYIPCNANYLTDYLPPLDFKDNRSGHWTIQVGDIIVKGTVTDEIDRISDLEKLYSDVYTINYFKDNRYGSSNMWHFEVGGF